MLKDVKITVLETPLNQPLAERYAPAGTTSCPNHHVGEVYISKGGTKPQAICDEAWATLSRYAFALASGAHHFWDDWVVPDNMALVTCADAFRPVVFQLETIE